MDGISFLFYLRLACHLVVSASFKRFGETVGSYRQNLQGKKKKAFPKLKSATTVIGFFILILN